MSPCAATAPAFTRCTQALLADRRERFLASAMGTELLCKLYGPAPPARR